jgi:N-acetylglutamate synthase-like GNAT family acetyltransferase
MTRKDTSLREVYEVAVAPGIVITTDATRMDLDWIHRTLSSSYWAQGIPRETVARSVEHSLSFALFENGQQAGFARVISDRATYAYIADVIIDHRLRGRGLGKALVAAMLAHPHLQNLRRLSLVTRDAHGLYAQFGFTQPASPEMYMEVVRPGLYEA